MKGRVGTNVLLFALSTAIALLSFSYRVLDDLARHQTRAALTRFIEEMTGAYTAAIILPIAIWTLGCVPFRLPTLRSPLRPRFTLLTSAGHAMLARPHR